MKEGRKDKNPWYNLRIKDKKSLYSFCSMIPIKVQHKKESMDKILSLGDGSDFY